MGAECLQNPLCIKMWFLLRNAPVPGIGPCTHSIDSGSLKKMVFPVT